MDETYKDVYNPISGILRRSSTYTYFVVRQLTHQDDFNNKIFEIRRQIALVSIFQGSYTERLERFNAHLEKLGSAKKDKFESDITSLVVELGLPLGWVYTLEYLIGAGVIFDPVVTLYFWNSPQQNSPFSSARGINLFIGEDISQDELCESIRKKWKYIKPLLRNLPKTPKPRKHKDSLDLGGIIAFMRIELGYSFSKIANELTQMSIEDPELFDNKEIFLSDSDIRMIYKRYKEKLNYKTSK